MAAEEVDDDASFIAGIVRDAAAEALRGVDMQGAEAEYVVVWWPKGRPIIAANMVHSRNTSLERTHDALEIAVAQIEASRLQ